MDTSKGHRIIVRIVIILWDIPKIRWGFPRMCILHLVCSCNLKTIEVVDTLVGHPLEDWIVRLSVLIVKLTPSWNLKAHVIDEFSGLLLVDHLTIEFQAIICKERDHELSDFILELLGWV